MTWLSKVRSTLTGEAEAAQAVRRELEALQRSRAKLVIEVTKPGSAEPEALTTIVEQVRDEDIVISQPSAGALNRPLATGERVLLRFTLATGVNVGESRSLGRIKLPSGGKRMFFGYRLSIPPRFETLDRRDHRRVALDEATAPVVHLTPVSQDDEAPRPSCSATMMDISLSGVQVKLETEHALFNVGDAMQLIADFPMPVGSIVHPVVVTRLEHDASERTTRAGLQFTAPVPNLEQFLETLQSRLARRIAPL